MKKNAYLLPVSPAVILMTASGLNGAYAIARRSGKSSWMQLGASGNAALGLAFGLGIIFTGYKCLTSPIELSTTACFASVAAVGPALMVRGANYRRIFIVQAAGFALLIFLLLTVVGPARRVKISESGIGPLNTGQAD